jgi:hypothetical protein
MAPSIRILSVLCGIDWPKVSISSLSSGRVHQQHWLHGKMSPRSTPSSHNSSSRTSWLSTRREISCAGAPTPGAIGLVTCVEPRNTQLSAQQARKEKRVARPPPVAKRESRDFFLSASPKLVEFVSLIS